jgi:uncharacterized protein (DUF934 family)
MKFIAPAEPLPAATAAWPNTDDVLTHGEQVHALPAIALHFPKWTDGRAYSQAVLLRQRLRYRGELIATGEVLADMMPLLRRCGFSAVQLRADQKLEAAQRALGWFDGSVHGQPPLHYQAAPGDTSRVPEARA